MADIQPKKQEQKQDPQQSREKIPQPNQKKQRKQHDQKSTPDMDKLQLNPFSLYSINLQGLGVGRNQLPGPHLTIPSPITPSKRLSIDMSKRLSLDMISSSKRLSLDLISSFLASEDGSHELDLDDIFVDEPKNQHFAPVKMEIQENASSELGSLFDDHDGINIVSSKKPFAMKNTPSPEYISSLSSSLGSSMNSSYGIDMSSPPIMKPTVSHLVPTKFPPINSEFGCRSNTSSPHPGEQQRFKPFHEEKWNLRLKELAAYRYEHGNCLVPHTYPKNPQLARWVKRQRRQYKLMAEGRTSTMTPDRLQLLNDIGFVWDSHEACWQEKLHELKCYKAKMGSCLVPSNYKKNPQLATWVKCQRRQYKLYWEGRPSAMTPERIVHLERVGFEWEIRSSTNSVDRSDYLILSQAISNL